VGFCCALWRLRAASGSFVLTAIFAGWAEIVLVVMGLALIGPAALAVALTGRPPRWWVFVDEALDIEKVLKRRVEKRNKSDR
jgi:hypothetical protein